MTKTGTPFENNLCFPTSSKRHIRYLPMRNSIDDIVNNKHKIGQPINKRQKEEITEAIVKLNTNPVPRL